MTTASLIEITIQITESERATRRKLLLCCYVVVVVVVVAVSAHHVNPTMVLSRQTIQHTTERCGAVLQSRITVTNNAHDWPEI